MTCCGLVTRWKKTKEEAEFRPCEHTYALPNEYAAIATTNTASTTHIFNVIQLCGMLFFVVTHRRPLGRQPLGQSIHRVRYLDLTKTGESFSASASWLTFNNEQLVPPTCNYKPHFDTKASARYLFLCTDFAVTAFGLQTKERRVHCVWTYCLSQISKEWFQHDQGALDVGDFWVKTRSYIHSGSIEINVSRCVTRILHPDTGEVICSLQESIDESCQALFGSMLVYNHDKQRIAFKSAITGKDLAIPSVLRGVIANVCSTPDICVLTYPYADSYSELIQYRLTRLSKDHPRKLTFLERFANRISSAVSFPQS